MSAGNFAAAPLLVRAQVPMMLCSDPADADRAGEMGLQHPAAPPSSRSKPASPICGTRRKSAKWACSTTRRPTPNLQKTVAEKEAAEYGLEVVGIEQYKQDDADLSVQLSKMQAAGAGAVLKIGLGGTTLTAAKNIKQLGSNLLLLTTLEDLAVFRPVAEVLGDHFFFVASPSQIYAELPDSPLKAEITKFITPWRAQIRRPGSQLGLPRLGRRDARGAAATKAGSTDGAKLRATLENT